MLAYAKTCAVMGLDGFVVQVEVDVAPGLPAFHIVGLPDTAVTEAKERVRAALRNSGCEFPMKRIAVNLSPADLKKEGPAYDLPIAVGILLRTGQIDATPPGAVFLGELSLDGTLRHTNGILTMVSVAGDQGYTSVYVPEIDAEEASLVEDVQVYPVSTLPQLISHLRLEEEIQPIQGDGGSKCGEWDSTGQDGLGPRARPRPRQEGVGSRRRRVPQPAVQRPAGKRQNAPGPLPPLDPAADGAAGSP